MATLIHNHLSFNKFSQRLGCWFKVISEKAINLAEETNRIRQLIFGTIQTQSLDTINYKSITNGILISEGEEVVDANVDVIVLEVVHEVCSVAAHLHMRAYRTEHNLSEPLSRINTKTDPSNWLFILDKD